MVDLRVRREEEEEPSSRQNTGYGPPATHTTSSHIPPLTLLHQHDVNLLSEEDSIKHSSTIAKHPT
jgi:hypothetical protein